jgi:hypothetical protein
VPVVDSHVPSRNCQRPEAELLELWMVGSPVPPVSHIITEHALLTWSAGKYEAISPSQPAHDPTVVALVLGGGGTAGGTVVVVGGTVVVVVGGTVVVVLGGCVVVVDSGTFQAGRARPAGVPATDTSAAESTVKAMTANTTSAVIPRTTAANAAVRRLTTLATHCRGQDGAAQT